MVTPSGMMVLEDDSNVEVVVVVEALAVADTVVDSDDTSGFELVPGDILV